MGIYSIKSILYLTQGYSQGLEYLLYKINFIFNTRILLRFRIFVDFVKLVVLSYNYI